MNMKEATKKMKQDSPKLAGLQKRREIWHLKGKGGSPFE